ncbi:acyl-CoA dehydrogenase, N-terminal domain protein [Mycolicibacterium hassiacum DSM 44199]|jgi:alkylation response protein AidB-like acyl-CoA dehydrogenase|uniref:Acyl-CoA dehydrogenase, N-terminal domain protein n=1 Tax=Mycolicibacterium hassiacum (strain DSM 44199 / CIP 105218 / JCM 12690 / 3849) TaxID=1122247 RepID=K5B714_MYCHD|nr:acyl-CoA dehydrogenase family protein [Mycolicibacterium hassiacum]EKF21153.1 acyl-CoA dehydrogenase, N-terminal domain protein [Mycolicibacterium hassiacum DSM 44199]MBX5487339.1 acyl-CoA dehydrogenase family protein [Mycolicibacterium hassiacum]MDA4086376.1 acyl-CoA dehydrogenase [Mycolicibacterium hassiacum DSM 44199]VCT91351.1 Acyl-CoA dehydrogenase [Mycolicibacterium hassiacum DSM 44199]
MRRNIFEPVHDEFRATAREFFERHCVPNVEKWEKQGKVDREAWLAAGAAGLIGWEFDPEYGGLGIKDFRFNQIISEEMFMTGSVGIGLGVQNDILVPYLKNLTTEEQKERWLPKFIRGEYIGSIAMSEPAAGSDLAGIRTTARDEGDHWVVNGQKTFISNGLLSSLVLTAVKTDPEAGHRGISLLMIEDGMEGFTRGRKLDKIGQYSADTAELFFDNVRVPKENLVGELNRGFYHLVENLPHERVGVACYALPAARRALELTKTYCQERHAFGQPIGKFQVNRHFIAEMQVKLDAAQTYLDQCVLALNEGTLSAADAAGLKWWTSEVQWEIIDRCLQLHGGYGYINEYEVARLWRDSRVQRLYAGTTEILKDLMGRAMGF